jgi:hypothetical protein
VSSEFAHREFGAALAAAREINDQSKRAEVLAALAARLSEDERPKLLAEALAAAREINDELERSSRA